MKKIIINKFLKEQGCQRKEDIDDLVMDMSDLGFKFLLYKLDEDYTDLLVTIKRKKYVIEISSIDDEKDIYFIPYSDYLHEYGNDSIEYMKEEVKFFNQHERKYKTVGNKIKKLIGCN